MNKKIHLLTACLLLAFAKPSIYASDNLDNRTYIIGHWNYPANSVNPIFVNSDGDNVELFINGIYFGKGKQEADSIFRFDNVIFQPGDLTAVGYDVNGKELGRYTLQTAGTPAQLKLTVTENSEGFRANGDDIAIIQFEIEDFQGKRCGADSRPVSLEIEGPAEWIGEIKSASELLSRKVIKVENGINNALIRSTNTPGEIKVTAKAKGLAPASVTLNSVSENAQD